MKESVAGKKGAGAWRAARAPNSICPTVCELHVHPDCVPFACSDCRQCHRDGHRDHVSVQGPDTGTGGGGPGLRSRRVADDPLRRMRTTTIGGRATCPRARAARSAGRRAAPPTCWPACAASGAVSRWAGAAPAVLVRAGTPFHLSPSASRPFWAGVPVVRKRVGDPCGRGWWWVGGCWPPVCPVEAGEVACGLEG